MKPYVSKFPWMPPPSKVPVRIQKSLEPFTPGIWGWSIWYQGKTRTVCGKLTPLDMVAKRWEDLKAQIDGKSLPARKAGAAKLLREGLSEYFTWLDHRVKTGTPKPLAAISAEDYKRMLTVFAKNGGEGKKFADVPMSQFGPDQFRAFAATLTKRSPTSFARIVATVYGFFSYCKDEGLIAELPNYGRYFVRPPQQLIRDRRLQQQKAWEKEDLWKIVEHANTQERAWIGLALSGALDNSDIAHLTFDLFDSSGMFLDYRRRKQGLMPRLIPLHPMARQWLDDYLEVRPKPAASAFKELVFLTPNGLPLQRELAGSNGIGNHIDYLAHCWDRLLRTAGLRNKPTIRRICAVCGKNRVAPRALCCGQRKYKKSLSMKASHGPDHRGFRSLRTTFANLVPRGFSDERKLVMGHSGGDITIDHYIEKYGKAHIQTLLNLVWEEAFTCKVENGVCGQT